MYAKQENGQIKRYLQLPEYYKNWAGTFHLQTDEIHRQEGFFPLVVPQPGVDFDKDTQKRGNEILWDEANQQYYYEVKDKVFDLEDLKQGHRDNVVVVINEISGIVSAVKNIYDPLRTNPENFPAEFVALVSQIVPLRQRAYAEIDALSTVQDALDYVVRGPEVEGYINQLKSFL